MELCEKVRARREALGLSQEELAKRMGYKSRTSINKIETGRPVTQKIIVRLSKALDVPVAYLMGWEQEPEELADVVAKVLLDPNTLAFMEQYLSLSESDQYTARLLVATLKEKEKRTSESAGPEVTKTVSLLETE